MYPVAPAPPHPPPPHPSNGVHEINLIAGTFGAHTDGTFGSKRDLWSLSNSPVPLPILHKHWHTNSKCKGKGTIDWSSKIFSNFRLFLPIQFMYVDCKSSPDFYISRLYRLVYSYNSLIGRFCQSVLILYSDQYLFWIYVTIFVLTDSVGNF